ncbi:MAG: nicotinic acid mononucleotide adenylyltransferase, partial [Dictyoglomaceae bacterium]|nr:nicotinic acid mononucleotide adenylyltransferase [Dictyoglomaceae bacterium]
DAFSQFLYWKDPEKIISLCSLIVGKRGKEKFDVNLQDFVKKYKDKIFFLDFPYLPISAQEIRERIKKGKSIKNLVPSLVETYIYKKGLYILY